MGHFTKSCLGMGLYIITIKKMFFSKYDPLMPNSEKQIWSQYNKIVK